MPKEPCFVPSIRAAQRREKLMEFGGSRRAVVPSWQGGARSVVAQRYCEVARRSIGSEWRKDEVVGQPSKVQNCERGFHCAKIVESVNMCP